VAGIGRTLAGFAAATDTPIAMPQENVEVVKRVYELGTRSWAGRDVPGAAVTRDQAAELWDPELVIEENAAFPDQAEYRGYDGLARWWNAFHEVYDEVRIEPRQLTAAGDRVIADCRHFLKSKSGVELERDLTHVWTVRNGRVVHVTGFMDRAEALEAVGLSDQDGTHGRSAEIVRRIYALWESREWSAIPDFFEPDIEIDLSRNVFNADVYRGHAGIERYLKSVDEVWEEFRIVPEEFIDAGDHVVTRVTIRGKGKGSGVEVTMQLFNIWTFRESKVVRIVGGYRDRSEALAAAGR
jgi:ketosteroid isomerase-like protein